MNTPNIRFRTFLVSSLLITTLCYSSIQYTKLNHEALFNFWKKYVIPLQCHQLHFSINSDSWGYFLSPPSLATLAPVLVDKLQRSESTTEH